VNGKSVADACRRLREQQRDMVFSLGYRGTNDEPFWNMDTECKTDECRGFTITQAIANESVIAKTVAAAAGAPPPRFVAYMWMELLELKEAGTLVLPPNVACVWTDFPGAFLFEGGFANVERARLVEAGAKPLRLGGRVLRAETAVGVGLGVVQHHLGDLALDA
jgi:hypothetical protein